VISGPLRTIVFAFLALMLGVGHSACASMAAPAKNAGAHAHQGHEANAGHSVDAAGDAHHQHGQKSTAPCEPDQSPCSHCQTAQFFKISTKPDTSSSIPSLKTAIAVFPISAIAPPAAISLRTLSNGYQWRDPPEDTPITLKIRLLN